MMVRVMAEFIELPLWGADALAGEAAESHG